MKILCISDQIDPIIYSPNIKERFDDVDIILSAGDLPLDYLDYIISTLNKPLFFVFGNHHNSEIVHYKKQQVYVPVEHFQMEYMGCGAFHLGSRAKKEGNLLLAGFGGSMRYNNGENQFTEIGMFFEIIKIIPRLMWNRLKHRRFLDILLTHAPPCGIHDKNDKCHKGFKIFLWFMKTFKPKYLVHGHIHLYDLNDVRCTKWKDTIVCNAYSHYLINTAD